MSSHDSTAPRPPAKAGEALRCVRDMATAGARYRTDRQRGMTLIELMMVVAVVAILAIIAVPSYRRYSMRAQRTEAKSALMKLQTEEERYYLQNHAYTLDPTVLGFASSKSENGRYTIGIATTAGVTQDYTATATTTGSMTQDTACKVFSIDSKGVRTSSPNLSCW